MSIRRLDAVWMVAAVVAVAVVTLVPVPAAGQEGAAWSPPRTADGQPDLQGIWASDSATPLERPEELADKATLTEEEVATLQARAAELFNGETDAAFGDSIFRAVLADRDDFKSRDGVTEKTPEATGNYNQFWFDPGNKVSETNQTSLVVDPPDGRVPPLTPVAEAKRAALRQTREGVNRHSPTYGGFVDDLGGCLDAFGLLRELLLRARQLGLGTIEHAQGPIELFREGLYRLLLLLHDAPDLVQIRRVFRDGEGRCQEQAEGYRVLEVH